LDGKWEPRKERNSGYISLGKSIKLGTHITPRCREETIRGDQIEHEGYRYTIDRYFARARLRSISYFSREHATEPEYALLSIRATYSSTHSLAYDHFITACCLSQNSAKGTPRRRRDVQTSDQANTEATAEKCMSQSWLRFSFMRLRFFCHVNRMIQAFPIHSRAHCFEQNLDATNSDFYIIRILDEFFVAKLVYTFGT